MSDNLIYIRAPQGSGIVHAIKEAGLANGAVVIEFNADARMKDVVFAMQKVEKIEKVVIVLDEFDQMRPVVREALLSRLSLTMKR